jgi:hypothetical protein
MTLLITTSPKTFKPATNKQRRRSPDAVSVALAPSGQWQYFFALQMRVFEILVSPLAPSRRALRIIDPLYQNQLTKLLIS